MPSALVYSVFRKKGFSEIFSGISVMSESDLFLNCDSYQILLPKQPKTTMELNIFEQTLLKLLRIRPMMTTGELADLTCLKADFVSALISSLIERGYLTEDNRPTDKVNEFAVRQESAEKMGVRLFAIRGTDKLLPIVCWDENNIIQGEYTNGSIRASWGSVGTERYISGRAKTYKFDTQRRPTGDAVLALLKSERKRLKDESINDAVLRKPTLEVAGPVFIHLKAIVQRGNVSEVLVSDGIWASNDDIVGYIKEADTGFFAETIRKASSKTYTIQEKQTKNYTGKYKTLKAICDKTGNFSGTMNKDDETSSRDKRLESMKRLYDALEWTLCYYIQNNRPDEQVLGAFFSQQSSDNMKLTLKAADNVGLFIGRNDAELFSRCDGKLLKRDLASDDHPVPNLDRLLPLCIVEAVRNPESGFHELIRINKSFLSVIRTLREAAKKIRHADNTAEIDDSLLERLNKNVVEIIKMLLPDFEDTAECSTGKIITGSSDKIANAIASITPDKLTYMEFGRLSEGCKNELLKIAPSLDANTMPDALEFVLTLSRAMEILLREKISLLHIDEYFDKNKAVNLLEAKLNGKIPEALARVSDWYYSQALSGKNSTLGAYAIVWAGHIDQDKFAPDELSWMLNFVSELSRLRGHGNSVGLMVSTDQLKSMREQLFMFIKKTVA